MEIASIIDHTILKSNCTSEDVERICDEAIRHGFKAVCIPPYFVKNASRLLEDHMIKVATVVGFPMGYSTIPAKVEEVKRAINDGADEIDAVVNICAIKEKDWAYVKNDIDSLTRASHLKGKIIKLIFEVELLTSEEINKLCEICNEIEVNFVKTSTGFSGTETDPKIIRILRSKLKPSIKIKASGGIRTLNAATAAVEAGADRIGCAASVSIVRTIHA